MADTTSDDLARRAWVAYLRQELTAPAVALAEYTRELVARAASLPPSPMTAEIDLIHNRAAHLLEMVQHLTIIDPAIGGDIDPERQRTIRHDLRAAVSYIVMACEDLLESLDEHSEPLRADVERTLLAAKPIIGSIEAVIRFNRTPEEPPSSVLRDMVKRLPDAVAGPHRPNENAITGRVWIVDDNAFGRDIVARMLTHLGHDVDVIGSGREAQIRLERCMEVNPAPPAAAPPCLPDLLLLDVMMPGITGPELLRWLKNDPRFWPIPVIMVSALGEDDTVLGCIAAGAEDYLTRPVRPELMRARITGCLEKKRLRDREAEYQARIASLIRAIFPPAVVSEWEQTGTIRARHHERVGVLFTDIVGFTALCERHQDRPEVVVRMLQDQVNRFEDTVRRHGVQKIKTIGDGFMGVAGLTEPDANPALTLLRCALDLIGDTTDHPAGWKMRAGIHVGPVVSGVLGKTQFSFDLWGHTVNAAARVESNGMPGCVTLSDEAWQALGGQAVGEERRVVARGIGEMSVWDFAAWK